MVGTRYRRGADDTASAMCRNTLDDETLVDCTVLWFAAFMPHSIAPKFDGHR